MSETLFEEDEPGTAEVLLPLALEGALTYLVPSGQEVAAGDYVRVPLGSRDMIGVVWDMQPAQTRPPVDRQKLRPISERLDAVAMSEQHRAFIDWIASYTLSPPGQVLRTSLRVPSALGPERQQTGYVMTGPLPENRTAQRERVAELAGAGSVWKAGDLARQAGVSTGVVKGLIDAGALTAHPLPAFVPFDAPDIAAQGPTLSSEQTTAADALRSQIDTGGFSVALLDGVTGSGKTEVYLEALRSALARGDQVLVLLPEIALTSRFLETVEQRFRAAPAAWHSALGPRERERVWRAVADGSAEIVVGARSALFLPFSSLGLIVVDEEHDPAYKQEDGLTYHARDMAVVRGSLGSFPVVLCSATPSVESHVNAERGRYRRLELVHRHGDAQLPDVSVIDMREAAPGPRKWLSEDLANAADATLKAGEQVLLFLNRRGYAPLTLCRTCGHRFECVQCDAWLVEHRFRQQMICHQCGYMTPVPHACPSCGTADALVSCGPGVERLAEEVRERFPEARTAILSSDLARGELLRTTLAQIADREFDLVIGTQLAAKGHHFPGLTLVGVIDADIGLSNGDPRASERTYQQLWQVSGRAGRAKQRGRALIQTYMPDHPLIKALAAKDRAAFYTHECRARETAGLPPYGRLAGIVVSSNDQEQAGQFAHALARAAPAASGVTVFGPAPAPHALIRGRHRFRLLVKTGRDVDIQAYLRSWLGAGPGTTGALRVSVDVDPQSFL